MNSKNNSLAINSVLIAISTSLISIIIHESAHYFIANYYNLNPELHHNYVKTLIAPTSKQLMQMAMAGPLLSLFLGLILLLISIKLVKPSLLKLFCLWFGMSNTLNFLGYMLIAPFINDGDTGRVYHYFKVPFFVAIVVAVSIFVITRKLFQYLSKEFIYYKSNKDFNKTENQKQLFTYPILFSIVIISILSIPIPVWFSLLPTIFVPLTYLSTSKAYNRLEIMDPRITINRVSITLVILTVISIFVFRYLI